MSRQEQSTPDWFAEKLEGEALQVGETLRRLRRGCAGRMHLTHAAQTMALSMGIRRIAHVPADRLYLWSARRYVKQLRKHYGRQSPMENIIRGQVFHHGRDLVLKQLGQAKGGRP
jgi:hypothetical protein